MRVLRAVFNKAQRLGLVTTGQAPFETVSFRQDTTEKLAIGPEILRKVAEAHPDTSELRVARDLFMFSFYARGMPFVDMSYLRRKQIENGQICYKRRKTGLPFMVKVTSELQHLLDRYAWCSPLGSAYHAAPRESGAVALRGAVRTRDRKRVPRVAAPPLQIGPGTFSQHLKTLSIKLKLSGKLSFNVARHS